MAQETNSQFGERMSVEEFLEKDKSKNLDVYPRLDEDGSRKTVFNEKTGKDESLYYFATEHTLGYVPKELGAKIEAKNNGEKVSIGKLFITEVTTKGYKEPMFMLCESKRESIFHFSID